MRSAYLRIATNDAADPVSAYRSAITEMAGLAEQLAAYPTIDATFGVSTDQENDAHPERDALLRLATSWQLGASEAQQEGAKVEPIVYRACADELVRLVATLNL